MTYTSQVTDTAGPPQTASVSHLGLSVTDLDRSLTFYCDVLRAPLVRPPNPGESPAFSGRMALVMLGPIGLDLFEHALNESEGFSPVRTGLDHLALTAESLSDLELWAAWLDAHDVPRSELRDAGGVGYLFDFVDPDGIQLEFVFLDPEKLRVSSTYSVAATVLNLDANPNP